MKIGDYVRKDGIIYKITEIGYVDNKPFSFMSNKDGWYMLEDSKSSPNIIDLIEVGDYINGHRVADIYEDVNGQVRMKFGENGLVLAYKSNYDNYYLFEEDIKSIVTKEQFSQMEYKVGD